MKPQSQKELEGTARADRNNSLPDSFPELEKIQRAPDHFNDGQRKHYKRICNLLFESGLLKKVDQLALEQLAVAYENFEQATKQINDFGPMNQYGQVSAWYTMQKDAMKIISDFSRRFGLSIADRKRMQIDSGKQSGQTDLFTSHLSNHPQLKKA